MLLKQCPLFLQDFGPSCSDLFSFSHQSFNQASQVHVKAVQGLAHCVALMLGTHYYVVIVCKKKKVTSWR